MSQETKDKVLAIFARDLPETARIMNPPSVTEEAEQVPPNTEYDDLPPQAVYNQYEDAMNELVDEGVLATGEVLGMKTYGLTKEGAANLDAVKQAKEVTPDAT